MQENYEEYSKIAGEQFSKLNSQDQDLCIVLRGSKPIYHLMNNDDYNTLINFKTKKEINRIYFSFDILGDMNIHPGILYKVNGSFISSTRGRNIVYTIHNSNNNSLYGVYSDNYISVKNNVILNEVTYINTRSNISRIEYVDLTIKKFPSEHDEIFIIDPDSDIYKLYSNKQIDVTTLCNLALLQAHNQSEQDELTGFTKQLSKRFI